MITSKQTFKKQLGFGLLVLAMIFSMACSSKIVRGAAPMVRMNELSHQNQNIKILLSMRNLNGVELDIQSIDFSLSVDGNELFTYQGPAETNIIANGTETWSVEVEESQSSRELLDTLQNGDVKSLPYSLEGKILTLDDGTLRFEHEGHIYPLPGKPGHFR